MSAALATLLAALPAAGMPRQDSTDAQLADVDALLQSRGYSATTDAEKALVANRLGMYDAADIYKLRARKSEVIVTA